MQRNNNILAIILLCFALGCDKDEGKVTSYAVSGGSETDDILGFSEDLGRIEVDGQRGYIDRTGKVVIIPQFEKAWQFSEGLAVVSMGGKKGYIDKTGKVVIPPVFMHAWDFKEGLAVAKKEKGKWGFIDKKGNWAIGPIFESVEYSFSEGLAPVVVKGKCGYVDKNGNMKIVSKYKGAMNFSGGLAAVKKGKRWGYINPVGKVIIPFDFVEASTFTETPHYACVIFARDKSRHGGFPRSFIDRSGKTIIPPDKSKCVLGFTEGLAMVIINKTNKYGFIDSTGKWAIAPRFDDALPFSEGLAPVCSRKRYGYIDKNGKFAIEAQYDGSLPFCQGIARVMIDDKWGYINRSGKWIWKPTK